MSPLFMRNTRSGGHERFIRDAKRDFPNEHDSFIFSSLG